MPDSQVDLPADQPLEVELRLLPKEGRKAKPTDNKKVDITSLTFFGMWSDREDIKNGAEWVCEERENWSNRHSSADS